MKPIEQGLFEKMHINRWFAATSAAGIGISGVQGLTGSIQSLYNQDYTAGQQAGEALAGMSGSMIGLGSAAWFGYAFNRPYGMSSQLVGAKPSRTVYDATKYQGNYYSLSEDGKYSHIGTNKPFRKTRMDHIDLNTSNYTVIDTDLAANIKKHGKTGFISSKVSNTSSGKFLRKSLLHNPFVGGVGMIVVPMIAEAVLSKAFGFAGELLDESHMAYDQSRRHTYDTRQFSNKAMQEWETYNMQTAGNALNSFDNKMSLSRVYHRR